MVHAALGYAKASRRLATLACTASIGPGATNMLTGAATATTNRLPGAAAARATRSPTAARARCSSSSSTRRTADLTVNDAFRPLSRFFDRIARPEQLLTALPQAMRVLLDPAETGAVTIALHQDVQGEAFDCPAAFFEPRIWHGRAPPPGASRAGRRRGASCASAERPAADRRRRRALLRGGGRAAALRRAARHPGGRDVGRQGRARRPASGWPAASASTARAPPTSWRATPTSSSASGTRLSDFTTGSHSLFQDPDVRFVGVNVNAADAAQAVGHAGRRRRARGARRAARGARRLDEPAGLRAGGRRRASQRWRVGPGRRRRAARRASRWGRARCCGRINATVRAGDWVVAAAGWQPGDLLKLWETPAGQLHAHRVRLLVHGPRDPGGARHPAARGRRTARWSS